MLVTGLLFFPEDDVSALSANTLAHIAAILFNDFILHGVIRHRRTHPIHCTAFQTEVFRLLHLTTKYVIIVEISD